MFARDVCRPWEYCRGRPCTVIAAGQVRSALWLSLRLSLSFFYQGRGVVGWPLLVGDYRQLRPCVGLEEL